MSFDMQFLGSNAGHVNDTLGCGQKWIRDTVFEYAEQSLELPGGYVPKATVSAIADKLKHPASIHAKNPTLQRVYQIFLQAKSMGLSARVSW